ncbi:MAG: LEA type 2 family protein, partial [Myxococcota bacterium]
MYCKRISACFLIFALVGCAGVQSAVPTEKPSASLDKVELTALSFQDMDLDFLVSVKNPYPLGLRVAAIKAKFLIEGNQIFDTETTEGLVINANASSPVPFRVNLAFADLARAAQDYATKEAVETEIQLVVTVKVHDGTIPGVPETWDFPFTLTKSLPTIKPKVSISNFKIQGPTTAQVRQQLEAKARELANEALQNVSPDTVVSALDSLLKGKPKKALKEALPVNVTIRDLDLRFALEFTLNLDNETPTALLFSNLQFKFQMNEEPLLDGNTTEVRREGNRSLA